MSTVPATATEPAKPTIMLVDGYGLIFRAYHAIQSSMSTASGEQTNAVYGFASMLFNLLNSMKPDYAVVALESGQTFRHEQFEAYKANRAEMPPELRPQVVRIRQLIDTLGIPVVERDGYEADDVIGSLARRFGRGDGIRVAVLTGDTDLLQLVDDNVEVFLPGIKRFDELRRYDRDAVVERYGFGPEFVPDYKALVGDTSDNIPGVPGIGEKSAKALIAQFGPIESIFDHVEEVTPTRAQNALRGQDELAASSKHLATIVQNLEIDLPIESSRVGEFDREALVNLLRELEFRSLLQRLPDTSVKPELPRDTRKDVTRQLITTEAALTDFLFSARTAGLLAVDVETTSQDPMRAELVGIALAYAPDKSSYIPLRHASADDQLPVDTVKHHLDNVLSDPDVTIVAHHGKYDVTVLQRSGIPVPRLSFDTMIAAYLVGETSVGLKDLAFRRLGFEMTEIADLIGSGKSQLTMNVVSAAEAGDYACRDVEATLGLHDIYAVELRKRELSTLFDEVEMPLVPVLCDMEQAGVAIDINYLEEFGDEMRQRLSESEREIHRLADQEFNINSTKKLASILFEDLGLASGRKTKTGYSVDQQVLENLKNDHPIVGHILEYRSLGKLLSTYVEALPQQVWPETGRVHTSYNQTVAATGRLSSANPNLQNIPIRTELGRRVRRAFVADRRPQHRLYQNATLLAADYSQIELRLMAHLSQEPFLLEAFNRGEDIHRATAGLVYGVSPDDVTSDMRRVAKTVNFGLLYGMQAFGLSRDTGLSRSEAQQFIQDYWSRLPKVREYLDQTMSFGVQHGFVQTLSGRRRLLPDLTSSNPARRAGAERMAINMPVQGTAADIMKMSMIRAAGSIDRKKLPARIIMQVHDELVIEVEESALLETALIVREAMENAFPISVPLLTELQSGPNWAELEEVTVDERE
ncbi:DNA polymerase I [soil metagenome]